MQREGRRRAGSVPPHRLATPPLKIDVGLATVAFIRNAIFPSSREGWLPRSGWHRDPLPGTATPSPAPPPSPRGTGERPSLPKEERKKRKQPHQANPNHPIEGRQGLTAQITLAIWHHLIVIKCTRKNMRVLMPSPPTPARAFAPQSRTGDNDRKRKSKLSSNSMQHLQLITGTGESSASQPSSFRSAHGGGRTKKKQTNHPEK